MPEPRRVFRPMRMRTYVLMLTSNDKGLIAELEIELAAIRLGIPVLRPLNEHARCDLGFDIGGRILESSVQVGPAESVPDGGDR